MRCTPPLIGNDPTLQTHARGKQTAGHRCADAWLQAMIDFDFQGVEPPHRSPEARAVFDPAEPFSER
jgi:hypothetical protein